MAAGEKRAKLPPQAARWPPPAFQLYASDLMASEAYLLASLGERGLVFSMLTWAWVNATVPASKAHLARLLGQNPVEVERAFGPLVEAHFRPDPNDEQRLFCPDLERQKQELAARRAKMRAGGSKGGRRSQALAHKGHNEESVPSSHPRSLAQAPERKRAEPKRGGLQDGDGRHEEWLRQYEGAPDEKNVARRVS